jgi:hypothetical protein
LLVIQSSFLASDDLCPVPTVVKSIQGFHYACSKDEFLCLWHWAYYGCLNSIMSVSCRCLHHVSFGGIKFTLRIKIIFFPFHVLLSLDFLITAVLAMTPPYLLPCKESDAKLWIFYHKNIHFSHILASAVFKCLPYTFLVYYSSFLTSLSIWISPSIDSVYIKVWAEMN